MKIVKFKSVYLLPLVTKSIYLPLRELKIGNVVFKKTFLLTIVRRWVTSGPEETRCGSRDPDP